MENLNSVVIRLLELLIHTEECVLEMLICLEGLCQETGLLILARIYRSHMNFVLKDVKIVHVGELSSGVFVHKLKY